MGIDPITHKPFSQILFDYGSISSLSTTPKPLTGPFSKTLTPTTMAKSQQPFASGALLGQQFQSPKKPHFSNEQPASSSSSSSINGGEVLFHFAGSSSSCLEQSNGSSSDSSFNSFVDALLEQDFEIRASFPEILEGCLDYWGIWVFFYVFVMSFLFFFFLLNFLFTTKCWVGIWTSTLMEGINVLNDLNVNLCSCSLWVLNNLKAQIWKKK